jgi:hypothetical protein
MGFVEDKETFDRAVGAANLQMAAHGRGVKRSGVKHTRRTRAKSTRIAAATLAAPALARQTMDVSALQTLSAPQTASAPQSVATATESIEAEPIETAEDIIDARPRRNRQKPKPIYDPSAALTAPQLASVPKSSMLYGSSSRGVEMRSKNCWTTRISYNNKAFRATYRTEQEARSAYTRACQRLGRSDQQAAVVASKNIDSADIQAAKDLSDFPGVSWCKSRQRWVAVRSATHPEGRKTVGRYKSEAEAQTAYTESMQGVSSNLRKGKYAHLGAHKKFQSGVRGIRWEPKPKRWVVQWRHNYEKIYVGRWPHAELHLAKAALLASKRTKQQEEPYQKKAKGRTEAAGVARALAIRKAKKNQLLTSALSSAVAKEIENKRAYHSQKERDLAYTRRLDASALPAIQAATNEHGQPFTPETAVVECCISSFPVMVHVQPEMRGESEELKGNLVPPIASGTGGSVLDIIRSGGCGRGYYGQTVGQVESSEILPMLKEALSALRRMLNHPRQQQLRGWVHKQVDQRGSIDADLYYFLAGESGASTGIKDVESACVRAANPYGNSAGQEKKVVKRKRQRQPRTGTQGGLGWIYIWDLGEEGNSKMISQVGK